MHQSPHAGGAAGVDHVLGAAHVEPLEVGRVAPVVHLRRRVERDLATLRPRLKRGGVVELAHDRLRAERADALGGPLGASKRADLPALASEALDESASDEARSTGDEGARQRFWSSSPHCHPLHWLCETSLILALPWLSRLMRKLVHAMLFAVVVSMKFPSGFAFETR